MYIKDFQTENYLNFGFIHNRYDLTNYGEYVWKLFYLNQNKEILLIVNEQHYVLRIIEI